MHHNNLSICNLSYCEIWFFNVKVKWLSRHVGLNENLKRNEMVHYIGMKSFICFCWMEYNNKPFVEITLNKLSD